MSIFVTGGTGFIGSHTCVSLLQAGYGVVIADNLSNSGIDVLAGIGTITGKTPAFHEIDLRDKDALRQVFEKEDIDAVIHFAGFKAVGESVREPLMYYDNNLMSTVSLLEVMQEYDVKKMVFSSSATVYGNPETVPITEEHPLSTTNPYGATKLMIEQILTDCCQADPSLSIAILRYFNPAGAHTSGLIGENPRGIPNNLFPYIAQVATGQLEKLMVFGNDYPTPDGTGVRDYIHVMDLAEGHLAALAYLENAGGSSVFNLGTGTGYSVLDIVRAFEEATGIKIPYEITGRRKGDVAACYSDPGKAFRNLKWQTKRNLTDMCKDAWAFQKQHFTR